MSTLGYAILGLLAAQPRTGYDLARLMRTPIGYKWTAHHSQIYPELARLEGEGLVAATVINGPGPRDTKRYEITPGPFVFAEYTTLRSGLIHVQATIAWLDWLLDRVDKVDGRTVLADARDPS